MGNPFAIFPEEIWADILEKVDDSENILRVLEIYPQLKILSRGKEFCWLIEDILPLIIPKYLPTSHIFVCRLVSKRWNNAICTLLETHPDRLSYKSSQLKKITELHFNYHTLPNISTDLAKFVKHFRGECVQKRANPFPGGHVTFNVENTRGSEDPLECFGGPGNLFHLPKLEYRHAIPLLKIYGHHITHLDIIISSVSAPGSESISDNVEFLWFQCFSYLPNLKSLTITELYVARDDIVGEERKQILEFLSKAEYPLQQLETLNVIDFYSEIDYCDVIQSLIISVAKHGQIRKLVICTKFWKSEYSALFPNLCDLHVGLSELWDLADKLKLKSILHDLECSPMRKLSITTGFIDIRDILEILAGYKIEFLEIVGIVAETREKEKEVRVNEQFSRCLKQLFKPQLSSKTSCGNSKERWDGKKVNVTVASIKYLSLKLEQGYNILFEFLNSLPSLEHLTVDIPDYILRLKRDRDYEELRNGFYECLKNFFLENPPDAETFKVVWQQFPNLKMLTLLKQNRTYQYARGYKKLDFFVNNK